MFGPILEAKCFRQLTSSLSCYIFCSPCSYLNFTKLHEFSRLIGSTLLYFCALPETSELWRCTTISSVFPSFNHFSCSFLLNFVSSRSLLRRASLRVRLCNFRPLDTGSKINPALNFVCGLRNPCLSSIQKGFVSNFKRFRYLGNFTCVRRSTKLASLQHTKISHLCHVLALSKMIQSEIYSAGLQFITLAQHL